MSDFDGVDGSARFNLEFRLEYLTSAERRIHDLKSCIRSRACRLWESIIQIVM